MSRVSLIVGFIAALGSVAHAGFGQGGTESAVSVSLDVALGTYIDTRYSDKTTMMDVTDTVTQAQYSIGSRGLIWDENKKTPLGHTPGFWFEVGMGWIGKASAPSGAESLDEGGGGLLMPLRMAGPWQFIRNDHMTLGAGIGFSFAIQMGLPGGTGRGLRAFAADAFLMSVLDIKLGGLRSIFEAEYAAGAGYNEQRAYARIGLGRWLVGGMLVAGQSDINYFQVGVNVGRTWEKTKKQ